MDVSVESFKTGIRLELNEEGRNQAGGTQKRWPGAQTAGHWGSRVTLTEFRGVDIIGEGDGLVMSNALKLGNSGLQGEFFTATTLWGGHIAVKGTSIVIGNNVLNTKIIGTYIDIGPGGGIFMEKGASDLSLIGVDLDLSRSAKSVGASKILTSSKNAAKSIKYVGTTIEEHEINVDNTSWINRLIK